MKINAIPEGLSETKTIVFLERILEVSEYRDEINFMNYYDEQWIKIQSKSKFDFIYKDDVEKLLKEYAGLGFPEYLSDGKRCFIELPLEELKNKF